MLFSTEALVLRCMDTSDYDRILTLLTPEQGRISVIAKGVRSPRSRFASACQPYVYGSYEIYRKGDTNWLRGGSVIEFFSDIRADIEKLSLSAYISDVAAEVTGELVPAVDILRMTLNTLYAIAKEIRPAADIKAVYEFRAAGYAGYMPDISHCALCRSDNAGVTYLDVMNGRLVCPVCLNRQPAAEPQEDSDPVYERSILMPLSAPALAGARYALSALPERMFSFRITDPAACREFHRAAEAYLLNHLERGFDSLNFYKSLVG
ncbi:MAG TPA: DNA repair protein RecO [Clostridiales bacterium]|mgnify:CR=1 FL=1|jgi:DNA repair protein RecO (recombination protein O)|nr:DNA repair protein RecO [Clostridiales bacterium]